ncbi:Protein of unknown function [Streptomyces sp. 3213]|uniref:DUF4238 domain-containing protein n=1 Tax=Streptomyces sp. 3213.3 TaxID=1855348 RepID=UPI000895761A|nr:DUF4238 domain-containing protein [Streptomyces sp. 3213.3]SED11513.1 Protein of unknown function [Streptomyces sp. 3213] [Streptomyces sp. 3213.3]
MSRRKGARPKQLKRRHHTVPKFYLRRFADARDQLMRVPIDAGKPHLCSVDDATVRKDFYSYTDEHGQLDDSPEDALGAMETQAAEVFRQVLDADWWPLPATARATLAEWVATQFVRGPADRQAHSEMYDQLVKMQIAIGGKAALRDHLVEIGEGEMTDEELDEAWQQMTDFSSYTIDAPVNEHLESLGHRITVATAILSTRTWALARFQRKTLITSDHPVILVRDAETPNFMGVGLANALTVAVPLDRHTSLIMLPPGGRDSRTPPSAAMAKDLNRRVAWNARSAVFHHPDDGPLTGIELPQPRPQEIAFSQSPNTFLDPDEGSS